MLCGSGCSESSMSDCNTDVKKMENTGKCKTGKIGQTDDFMDY